MKALIDLYRIEQFKTVCNPFNIIVLPKNCNFEKNLFKLLLVPAGVLLLDPAGAVPPAPAVRRPSTRNAARASLAKGSLRSPCDPSKYWIRGNSKFSALGMTTLQPIGEKKFLFGS